MLVKLTAHLQKVTIGLGHVCKKLLFGLAEQLGTLSDVLNCFVHLALQILQRIYLSVLSLNRVRLFRLKQLKIFVHLVLQFLQLQHGLLNSFIVLGEVLNSHVVLLDNQFKFKDLVAVFHLSLLQ